MPAPNVPHTHELAATWMMKLLDYDTINMGCHTCGPQWVITINWTDQTLYVSWVNAPWSMYFDAQKRELKVETHRDDAARGT